MEWNVHIKYRNRFKSDKEIEDHMHSKGSIRIYQRKVKIIKQKSSNKIQEIYIHRNIQYLLSLFGLILFHGKQKTKYASTFNVRMHSNIVKKIKSMECRLKLNPNREILLVHSKN